MTETDILTLAAFLVALSQLDSPLDATLQAEINQLGQQLETDLPAAVENLRKLIRQHKFIEQLYKPARTALQSMYQAKPRNKCILPLDAVAEPENLELKNLVRSLDSLKITQQIFSSGDSVGTNQKVKAEIEAASDLSSGELVPNSPPDNSQDQNLAMPNSDLSFIWVRRLFG